MERSFPKDLKNVLHNSKKLRIDVVDKNESGEYRMANVGNSKTDRKVSYLLYLICFFILGILVSDNVNIDGTILQEIVNRLIKLDIQKIVLIFVGIQILSVILTVVIGIVKNLDAEKGLKYIFFTMSSIGLEMVMLFIYKLVSQ